MSDMRALAIQNPGANATLQLSARAVPALGIRQVRVQVHASGLNRADVLQFRGRYPAPPGVQNPDVPGLEFAGVVLATTGAIPVGTRVMGLLAGGAHAEEIVADEDVVLPISAHWDFSFAAGFLETFATAYDALVLQAGLRSKDRVLIHAIGSGVGMAALHIVRAFGASAIGSSRNPEKLEYAKRFGMHTGLLVTGDPQYADALTADGGVDIVINPVGAGYFAQDLRALATHGRIVVLGLLSGNMAELPLAELLRKQAVVRGSTLRGRSNGEKKRLLTEVAHYAKNHLYEPETVATWSSTISTYPPERAEHAFFDVERNRLPTPKAVLQWR